MNGEKSISCMITEVINLYFIEKIFHKKTGKCTFVLHVVDRTNIDQWIKIHPNHRELSKEVFDKIKEHKILPEVLFENLSASFPDRQFDYNALPAAICQQLNTRFNEE